MDWLSGALEYGALLRASRGPIFRAMGILGPIRASFASLCVWSAGTLIGCGGKAVSDGGAGAVSHESNPGGAGAVSHESNPGGAGAVSHESNPGGAGGDAPDAASTTAAGGTPAKTSAKTPRDPDLDLSINSSGSGFIGVDCRNPQADPVSTNFNLVPYNKGTTTKDVTFSNAQVKFTNGSRKLTWRFQIAPTDSGPVRPEGPLFGIPMWNVPNSGSGIGTGTPCDYACDQPVEFSLDVTEAEIGSWTLVWMSALDCPG